VDLVDLAENHILTGGALTNVVRYAAIRAGRHGREMIARDDLLRGIKKESIKEGRTL
jgi:hypothetical protein